MCRCVILLFAALLAAGQGIEPKPDAGAYPGHAAAGDIAFGAENWGHGFASQAGSFVLQDYIAVEVAVFTKDNRPVRISSGDFTLTLNGKRIPLLPQSNGMVAASLKYPDWEQRPELVATAGTGAGDVILGRSRPVERFPGDGRADDRIKLPRAPAPDTGGRPAKQTLTVDEIVSGAAFPAGEIHPPASGFLFFAYKGKMKSVKSVVLRYDGPAGSVQLTLR